MDNALADTLALVNPFARAEFHEGLVRWPGDTVVASKRSKLFRRLQSHRQSAAAPPWAALAADVQTLAPLLRAPTAAETESYDQVCFRGSPWSQLNAIPFALVIVAFYKTWITPAFGVMMPFLTWILPYLFLRSIGGMHLNFTDYTKMLWKMWNGQLSTSLGLDLPPGDTASLVTQIKQLLQNGWTLFTLAQAVWHPIQQARHFSHLDTSCVVLGEAIVRVKGVAASVLETWSQWLPSWMNGWLSLCPDDTREAFAYVIESPFWLPHVLRGLGRFECLWQLAAREDVCATDFIESATPVLMLKGFGDPLISTEKRIVSSLRLGGGGCHAILTGPNRGGKSSLMRGILLNVRLAHAFGAAFATKAQMSRFAWIADGLRLDDQPGKLSMFEREVGFAQAILTPRPGPGLCLYDELFHSTNPPDAARTSEAFCSRLWTRTDCLSLVSTHVYALARDAPASVKKVCVAAWNRGERYTFSYTLQRGICEVSSVDLLLRQHGLLSPAATSGTAAASGAATAAATAAEKLLPSEQK